MSGHWVYGALVLMLVLHSVALLFAYRHGGESAGAGSEEGDRRYRTEDGIECAECGTVNGKSYRYCRQCVSELPGNVSLLGRSTSTRERQVQ